MGEADGELPDPVAEPLPEKGKGVLARAVARQDLRNAARAQLFGELFPLTAR